MGIKNKIAGYVKKWESKGYEDGIPDEAPIELEKRFIVPSYRIICSQILKNPYNLEDIGISREKSLVYHEIKKEEIKQRQNDKKR